MAGNQAIPHEILDVLEEGLKRLREYNGRFHSPSAKSTFWFASTQTPSPNKKRKSKAQKPNDDATLGEYNRALRRYRLASKVLQDMSRSLDIEINRIESEIQPMVLARGIAKIPDEVLALIMRSLYEPWNPNEVVKPQPEDLKLVCKRFRDIVDSQPSLWSFLSSAMNAAEVSQRLDRVGLPVGLKIYLKDVHPNFCAFVNSVVPCASRWERVYFDYSGSKDANVKRAYAKLKDLSLPRLTQLFLQSSQLDRLAKRKEMDRLLSTWKTPILDRVVSRGGIPAKLKSRKSIKSFELDENCGWFMESGYLNQLSNFLSEAESLTSLRLHISELTDDDASSEDIEGIELPNLQKLNVYLRFLEYDSIEDEIDRVDALGNALYKFISQLETPALEEIAVVVEHDPVWEEQTEEFLTDLLQTQAESMHLRKIEFTQNGLPLEIGESSLLNILQNLHLEGTAVFTRIAIRQGSSKSLVKNMSKEPPRNLRRLQFKDCSLSAEDVGALLKVLTKRAVYPKFEALVLTRCSGIKKDELRGKAGLEFVVYDDE